MMRKILITSLLFASITAASAQDPDPKSIFLDDALAKIDQKTLIQDAIDIKNMQAMYDQITANPGERASLKKSISFLQRRDAQIREGIKNKALKAKVESTVAEFSKLTLMNGLSNLNQCMAQFRSQNSSMKPEEQEELGHAWCLERTAQGSDQIQANAMAPTSGSVTAIGTALIQKGPPDKISVEEYGATPAVDSQH
jgi:hypothetical protein